MRAPELLTSTDDCALAVNHTGQVVDVNAAAEHLLGFRRDEVLGRQCHEVLGCRDLGNCALNPETCPLLNAVRSERLLPGVDLLVSHRGGCAIEVSASAFLLPERAGARALLLIRPSPDGVVDTSGGLASRPATGPRSTAEHDRRPRTDLAGSLDRLLIATGADAAELFLTVPGGAQLVLVAHRGRAPRAFRQIARFEPGQGFPGLVAQTGKPIVSLDLPHDDRYLRTSVKQQGFHSYLCVPVWSDADLLGSLHVAFRRRAQAVGPLLPFLMRVAPHLATALEIARLRAAELVVAQPLDEKGDAGLNLQRVADQALETLMEVAGVDCGALLLADDQSDALHAVSEQGLSPRLQRVLACACDPSTCPAIAGQRGVLPSDRAWAESPCCRAVQRHLAPALCLPLQVEGKPLGVALLGSGQRDPLPTRHLSFLHAALSRAAVMIHNAQVALREENAARVRAASGSALTAAVVIPTPEASAGVATGVPFLDLHCLGQFAVIRDGLLVPPQRFARRRSLSLLKVLLTRYGKPVHREELMELLWPDGDPRSTGDLLNVVVHYLRRGLEPRSPADQPSSFIRTQGEYYAFDSQSPHRLDSQELLEAMRLGQQREARGQQAGALEAYQCAIALYAGDFLEDELYSDWCALEREYLRESFLTALRRAARLHLGRGEVGGGVSCYRRALLTDATLEEVHRALMEALWRAGRRDEALRQYRECRAILERELGVAPMPETEALRQRIATESGLAPVETLL